MKREEYTWMFFLRMMLDHEYHWSKDEVYSWAEQLGLDFQRPYWRCVVVRIESCFLQGKNRNFFLDIVSQCKRTADRIYKKSYVCVAGEMDICLMLNQGTADEEDESQLLLCDTLIKKVKCELRIGIGRCYEQFEDIYCSYHDALDSLAIADKRTIVTNIRDLSQMCSLSASSSRNAKLMILEKFRNNELENLRKDLESLAEMVRGDAIVRKDSPYPSSIRRTMIELLFEMMHIAADTGVDVDLVIGNIDPYRKVFELVGTPLIIEWITDLAGKLSDAMQEQQKMAENRVIGQVYAYIEEHLGDMDLSLSMVSHAVGMSAHYFSAFFIRETDQGFKEYVTSRRISLAQKQLEETEDSVNVISEQCGFLSPSYFISVFKKQVGLTPGTYRKKMKN